MLPFDEMDGLSKQHTSRQLLNAAIWGPLVQDSWGDLAEGQFTMLPTTLNVITFDGGDRELYYFDNVNVV